MSSFNFKGDIDVSKNSFGFGEFKFSNSRILYNGELIEENFTGTLAELQERHPNLDIKKEDNE